jgi:hypothetical protein
MRRRSLDERGCARRCAGRRTEPAGRVADGDAARPILERLAGEKATRRWRHAGAELVDPVRNPYRARSSTRARPKRWRTTRWVLFGPLWKVRSASALGAVEYLLDLPWRVQGALLPIRLIRLPWRPSTPGAAEVAVHARRYLDASRAETHADKFADWLRVVRAQPRELVGRCASARGAGPTRATPSSTCCARAPAEQALNVATQERAAICARACSRTSCARSSNAARPRGQRGARQ